MFMLTGALRFVRSVYRVEPENGPIIMFKSGFSQLSLLFMPCQTILKTVVYFVRVSQKLLHSLKIRLFCH